MIKLTASLCFLLILTFAGTGPLWAHGGGHDAPAPQPETTLPELPEETIHEGPLMQESFVSEETLSPAETKGGDAGPVDYGMGDMPADAKGLEGQEGTDPLWGDESHLPGAEPAPMDLTQMEGHGEHAMEGGGHAAMTKDHVQPAEHEWINTSRKGYGWALALVLLSGVWFGFLDFKKPFEE